MLRIPFDGNFPTTARYILEGEHEAWKGFDFLVHLLDIVTHYIIVSIENCWGVLKISFRDHTTIKKEFTKYGIIFNFFIN